MFPRMYLLHLMILLATFSSTYGAACTDTRIVACLRIFEGYADEDATFTPYNRTQLKRLCRAYDSFDACVQPFQHNCNQTTRNQLEGLDLAYEYVCSSTGFEIRVRNYECFDKTSVHSGVEYCAAIFKRESERIIRALKYVFTRSELNRLVSQFCNAAEALFRCSKSVFQRECNSEVAVFQDRVERLMIKPLLDELNCPASGLGQKTTTARQYNITPARQRTTPRYTNWYTTRKPVDRDVPCTSSRVRACNRLLEGFGDEDATYTAYTRSQLTALCRAYDSFDTCVRPFKYNCEQRVRYQLVGIDLAFNYVCSSDGFEIRVRNYNCFAKASVHAGAEICVARFKTESERIMEALDDASTTREIKRLKEEFCSAIEDLFQCIKSVFQNQCNADVASFQEKVERLRLKPALDELNCPALKPGQRGRKSAAGRVHNSIYLSLLLSLVMLI